ncbi:hypothetical protein EV126DRAFT_84406 [Verticillium dahliae]|nr:hypothetical protein EV126DRAFT_84406 [Verticillium dahliae]
MLTIFRKLASISTRFQLGCLASTPSSQGAAGEMLVQRMVLGVAIAAGVGKAWKDASDWQSGNGHGGVAAHAAFAVRSSHIMCLRMTCSVRCACACACAGRSRCRGFGVRHGKMRSVLVAEAVRLKRVSPLRHSAAVTVRVTRPGRHSWAVRR